MYAFTHDRWTFPLPPTNRFPQEKYRLVRERVERLPGIDLSEGVPITWDDALLVHDAEWVRRIRHGLLTRREEAALGLTWSPELAQRTLHATGSTVAATRAALTDGVAAALGGGTHHAHRAVGRGYCLINDVAVSLELIRLDGFIGKCTARRRPRRARPPHSVRLRLPPLWSRPVGGRPTRPPLPDDSGTRGARPSRNHLDPRPRHPARCDPRWRLRRADRNDSRHSGSQRGARG